MRDSISMWVLSRQFKMCLLAHPVAQVLLKAKPGAHTLYLLQRLRPMAAHCLSCTTCGGTSYVASNGRVNMFMPCWLHVQLTFSNT